MMDSAGASRICRCSDLELSASLFELRRRGRRVELQPKTLHLLLYLLCHRDRFVSKDALAAHHLDAGLRMNTRIGARPWVGWTHHDFALLWLRRGRNSGREQAPAKLARAREQAEALGMGRLASRVAELAAIIG